MPEQTTAAPAATPPPVDTKDSTEQPQKPEGKLVKLLGKISPGLARKIAEKGAKKCGMDYKTAGYVGKAVEKGVQKKQSEDLAAKTAAEGGAVPPTAPPKA